MKFNELWIVIQLFGFFFPLLIKEPTVSCDITNKFKFRKNVRENLLVKQFQNVNSTR